MQKSKEKFRCVIHGSFRRHFDLMQKVRSVFIAAGIEVLAPRAEEITSFKGGFGLFGDEEQKDPRLIELLYLHHLKRLSRNGFSYFVDPEGYIGTSAAYELGIAQLTNTRCFFLETPANHPVYVHKNAIWSPEDLAGHILEKEALPEPQVKPDEREIHRLWLDLMVPGSVVATGGIIEHENDRGGKEILLVKTHKWGDRWSIVGGKVRRNETLRQALEREVYEETSLAGKLGAHLCTFDQVKDSGYFMPGIQHIFVDHVFRVGEKKVRLNEEAQEYVWMSAEEALRDLDIEPNARHTIQAYARYAGMAAR